MINRRIRPAGAVSVGPDGRGATVPGLSPATGAGKSSWTPTVANLLVLVVLELAAFAALRYAFRVLGS